ncbi:hypothetical protein [Umezawaea beigongshangensis]|uniref:hypothetical protein n=1 Tax=Umezawaea beigongshangensis TaxID=2780383 RepID=UPI0018F21F07|nr:hypothetical protein [Umezawaea beigongshangensis]
MATALRVFHRYALVGEGWSAEGGASLRTFFVGDCLRAFPTVYRRWCAEQGKEEPYGLNEADAPPAASSLRKCPNPAEQIVAQHATRDKLRRISKTVSYMVVGRCVGHG